MKLSKTMLDVLKKMQDGWEWSWNVSRGCQELFPPGRPDSAITVREATVVSLCVRGLIRNSWGGIAFTLTSAGITAVEDG